jgi:hypothetical protein
MTVQVFTLVMQFAILAVIGWTSWTMYKIHKRLRESSGMIAQFRREVDWLTTRIDLLESRPFSAPKAVTINAKSGEIK